MELSRSCLTTCAVVYSVTGIKRSVLRRCKYNMCAKLIRSTNGYSKISVLFRSHCTALNDETISLLREKHPAVRDANENNKLEGPYERESTQWL